MSLEWTPTADAENLSARAANARQVLELRADYQQALASVVRWRDRHASATRTMTWAIGSLLLMILFEFAVIVRMWSAMKAAGVGL